MSRRIALVLAATIAAACGIACGGKAVFRLSSDENNNYELGRTLSRRQLPDAPTPVNESHQPRVFALTAGGKANAKTIIPIVVSKPASRNLMVFMASPPIRTSIGRTRSYGKLAHF